MNETIREKLKLLPEHPGCYLMKDISGNIIYVGKAKILKNRVKSYFTGSHNAKTTLLVSEIEDFHYIITASELEAFILELNLIKKHQPKYNIKLMDDKTYPYILLTKEDHPQILVVRNNKKKGQMFGPYPNVTSARETVRLLQMLYPFRKCRHLPKQECLYYHMHECLAPCIKEVKKEDYSEYIKKVTAFLKGDTKDTLNELSEKMMEYSSNLEFERAKDIRDLINSINDTIEKQKISINDGINRDVFAYYADDTNICIYMLFMRNGHIVASDTVVLSLYDEAEEMFSTFLAQYYAENMEVQEVLVPHEIPNLASILKSNVFVPQKGEKKRLIEMAYDNAKLTLDNKQELYRNKNEVKINALNQLKEMLDIPYPKRIEIFDNSNIYGSDAVSGMVCFINGQKAPNEYRKYRVKTVVGADDYKTTKEIVYRRYYRVLMDDLDKPDLIIIDGGYGHLNAVLEVLSSLNLDIPAIGLKKDNNHKTESIIYQNKEYSIKQNKELFQFCFSMQEEVHRYAITFHKSVRGKSMFKSKLEGIKGLGVKGKEKLLKEFGSIDKIKEASKRDFERIGLGSLFDKVMEHLQ